VLSMGCSLEPWNFSCREKSSNPGDALPRHPRHFTRPPREKGAQASI
jgi:hypothetical protein